MTQGRGRLFDDLGRLVSGAAGVLDGARREVGEMARTRMEGALRDLDVPSREEFEALRDMVVRAREENERLGARLSALEGGNFAASGVATASLDRVAADDFGEAAGEPAVEAERTSPT